MDTEHVTLVTRYLMGMPDGATIIREEDDESWFGDSHDVASYGVELVPEDEARDRVDEFGDLKDDEPDEGGHAGPLAIDFETDGELVVKANGCGGGDGRF
ncbi:hypothetical protein [Natrialba aegyptia]|uniref:Uncharacterized protein n=1 Tax=Natrialba aegyptia DSM 13077 TaxID=1227491 RepID=M0B4W4_9EURY|nr:hypothetical protein [Natrialba aegyptia]ELZ05303.1 hypothetical protein C480_10485 [Natrialba aegyptia DSM 13077]